jgi:purine-nucleoside phosphorylase
MPGDPRRAAYIAEHFLEAPRQINAIRNMVAYTGAFHGRPVSVMGSGMGIPSISLYAHELFAKFNVDHIIRVGTCGAIHPDLKLREVVLGMGASTDSNVNRLRFGDLDFAALASDHLLEAARRAARQREVPLRVGNLFSSDLFYHPGDHLLTSLRRMGILAIEMEAAGLYGCATLCGKEALAVCTVSDILETGERLSPEAREKELNEMIQLSLETAVSLASA